MTAQCEQCFDWTLDQTDSYCGWCAAELGQVTFESERIAVFWADETNRLEREISIYNRSPFDTRLHIEEYPSWMNFPAGLEVNIGSQDQAILRTVIDTIDFDVLPAPAGCVVLRSDPQEREFRLAVVVEDKPEINAPQRRLSLVRGIKEKATLRLFCWQNLLVRSATFDPPWLTLAVDSIPHDPEGGGPLELPVLANVPSNAPLEKQRIECRLMIEGLKESLTVVVPVGVKGPPCLRIAAMRDLHPVLVPSAVESFSISIRNGGREPLSISKVAANAERSQGSPEISVVRSELPLEIGRDETKPLRFDVKLPAGATDGVWLFELKFESNDPNPGQNRVGLRLNVENREFEGYVAVDYGTADSAVAVIEEESSLPRNERFSEVDGIKINSNILFMNHDEKRDPPWVWKIGKEATVAGRDNRDRFFRSVKTRVGNAEDAELIFAEKSRRLELDQMAVFIISDLIRCAQRQLGRRCRRFVLCIPTRFTLLRKKALKDIFEKAARLAGTTCEELELIDESLAAGLFYILHQAPVDPAIAQKYSLMIVDFGGGTTDVTVLEVEKKGEGAETVFRAEIVGAWGDPSLGGERITEEIAEILARRFLKKRDDLHSGDAVPAHDKESQLDEAEAAKIVFSELGRLRQEERDHCDAKSLLEQARESFIQELSYVTVADGPPPPYEKLLEALEGYLKDGRLEICSEDFDGASVTLSENDVEEIYRRRLTRLRAELEKFLKKIGIEQVDVLLLAGQSSRYPSVRNLLSGLAGQVDFVRSQTGDLILKECVSLGAAAYSVTLSEGAFGLELHGDRRYWTRLGRREGPERDFKEYLPWGVEYPCQSKEIKLAPALIRHGRLRWNISENTSLHDDGFANDEDLRANTPKFATFAADVGETCHGLKGQLRISESGDIEAYCKIDGEWKEMEREP